ncbi:biotin synthase BioB [Desulfovibrio ferrophilus]|uniref:Biotin synthase n=1 Tax=Desulfovibrio ferrophilus TaxID=241368 RepID=A0A2Z6B2G2_9BACT|nr:biotin synthase BioB [Desulfovibrio ferrophilus]BBD09709.1 biotin synthase [Desulfovibrio ferrophilus]
MSEFFQNLAERILGGTPLSDQEAYDLGKRVSSAQGDDLSALAAAALRLKESHFPGVMSLCSIVNAKSGRCSENCKFCAQSSHHDTQCDEYPFIDVDKILAAARAMREAGASRFAVVTSGKGLTGDDFEQLLKAINGIRTLGLAADASVGILHPEQLQAMKAAGLQAYHHNLETARSFFPEVCTTHAYDEDVATVRAAMEADLYVCCGGLFGLGENWDHRVELALELRSLGVDSIPVNFLTPIPGTPYGKRDIMLPEEAIRIVALLRFILPQQHIRICGGRPAVFGSRKAEALTCGASGLMIGDYLTTRGEAAASDLDDLKRLGLKPE